MGKSTFLRHARNSDQRAREGGLLLRSAEPGQRLRKAERREQILLELRLRPHVRLSELAPRFGVSGETVRRDVEELRRDGLLSRAHGGASAPELAHYPTLDERNRARIEERERIGRHAAGLVRPGESVMIDSGSTTLQAARFLALAGTACKVVTNSLPVAMALGHSAAAEVILCPGDYLPPESAVVGTDTVEFIDRLHVDLCLIGAFGVTVEGPCESVRGYAAVKRAMLRRGGRAHLLIDAQKFGRHGLAHVTGFDAFDSVIVDSEPDPELRAALDAAGVEVAIAA
ncbi:DeoR/GlpR family DNA-binding transcription regulator [Halovulum marinum]|uniref:DeoR/GlpR family DNA-binding transcription regulator n=1 Tax=Halovulum marinum TaxID=2662447 RepID=UPI001F2432E2|nr:DeoR/GlpR family DNA-binding transcription regulator [Halovulum marinum]